MRKYKMVWIGFVCMVFSFGGCVCDNPMDVDGTIHRGEGTQVDWGTDGGGHNNDNGIVRPKDQRVGCPPFWTVKMSAVGAPQLFAVFCPPPTITGCHALQAGPKCTVADTPLITFSLMPATKLYEVSHSGSIEQNSHGILAPGADATKPDRISKIPENTKVRALFSGIPISFQFKGDEITVFKPE